jgi:amino acid adenylation domain-containing protein/thioester reductase-like protein
MDSSRLARLSAEEKRALLARLLRRRAGDANGAPLSHGQRALWFLHRLAPDSAAYNLHFCARIRSPLDPEILRRSFDALTARHESLRATFPERPDGPAVVAHDPVPVPLPIYDASRWSADELDLRLHAEAHQPFDLARGPVHRATLFRRADDDHYLLLTVHHIVSDYWTLGVLMDELNTIYRAVRAGAAVPLPPPERSYADFVAWQQDLLAGPEGDRLWEYWREKLSAPVGETLPALSLPTDRPRPAVLSDRGATQRFSLDAALTGKLKDLARAERTTLFAVLLAAYQAFLHRLTGEDDIPIGSPVACRGRPEFAGLVGYLVNMIVLRADVSGRPIFRGLLGQVKQTVLDALAHQDFPFALVVERLQPARDLSRSPLFQAAFTLTRARPAVGGGDAPRLHSSTNGHAKPALELGGLALEPIALEQRAAQFDWNWLVEETGDELATALQYRADLFDAATIERWMGHFQTFLRGVADNPDEVVTRLPLLEPGERAQLLAACHGPSAERPAVGLQRLIEQQVSRTPDAVALVYERERLTYRELNRRASQLGRHLRTLGAGADVPVALCVERSLEMVIGLLAVLKAGAAYVPLDPDLPAERLAFLLDDLAAPVVLTQAHLADRLSLGERRGACPTCSPTVLRLDADAARWAYESDDDLPDSPAASPDNLAYIIYTSGSTGQPKGCMNTHRGIVNRLLWMQEEYGLTTDDRVLQKTPYSFDVSVWEFFWPLLTGARLVIAKPGGHKDADYLVRLIADERVTVLHFVPSMLQVFLQAEGLHRCNSLRHVICSGEALSWDLQEQFGRSFATALHNLYGPTEAAVDVTYWVCEPTDARKLVPIGRPISNTGIYILDSDLQPLPIGVPGELHIGGVNLARGYLNRPELTAEKFIADPFRAGERLYKTGDLARYLSDGAVEYLGRLDHQVKVRGFRIELGEIEATLTLHPAVREAVVVARGDAAAQRLVAYIVPQSAAPAPSTTELRSFLGGKLAEYMVPAAFVMLDTLPLSPNGKVDRKSLPAPGTDRPDLAAEFVSPATSTERKLAAIWAEVLQVERIGSHDGFFELGGHSLLATQVITRVKSQFGVELPLRQLFEATTLADFAATIDAALASLPVADQPTVLRGLSLADAPLRYVPRDEPPPMSFGQETLWFLDQLEPGNSSYNCPAAVHLKGRLDLHALRRAFELIVHRHESLRSSFALRGERRVVVINPPTDLPLTVTDLRGLAAEERARQADALIDAEAARPFDLTRGPLLRLGVIRLTDDESIVLMTVHHIAYDGWSTGVLVHEFATLYKAVLAGKDLRHRAGGPAILPPLPIQYPDFAYWQRQWQQDGLFDGQLAYWTKQLDGIPPLLDLPTDRPRPQVWSFNGSVLPLRFPPELVAGMRALGRREGCTLFMTMLSAFQTLLHRWSGQDDICVGSPIANRNRAETEGLIGFVVNTLVLRGNLTGDPTFLELMRRNREVALGAYSHQDLPFERLMQALHPTRDVRHSSLFQVLFVLQNAPVHIPPLPGLTPKLLLDRHNNTAKFDLTLGLTEMPEGLVGIFEYNTDLFDRSTIERMAAQFRRLLEEAVRDPSQTIGAIPLLGDEERARLLAAAEAARTPDADDPRCIHHLFERQAAAKPHATALVMGESRLSYAELNDRANRLAHYLLRRGVGPEVTVGIYTEKTVESVIGIFAVLKAGGAYVPLDTALPRDRLTVILADAGPAVVLTQDRLAADLPFDGDRIVRIDGDARSWADESDANPEGGADCRNLAYVIYTSGSTGTPKGCMIEHRSVVSAFHGWEAAYGLSELPTYLQMANLAFDVFTGDLVRALGSGGTLLLCPTETLLDPPQLLALLRREKIAYAEFVPAVVRPVLRHLEETGQTMDPVKLVVCGSDVWYGGEFRRLRRVLPPGARLINSYGLTEATIDNTYFEGDDEHLADDGSIPIGRPYANQRVYVLDARLNPQPVGVPGELHVGGVCLARGYLNRPELTAEKFIPDPIHTGERLYKSGDLARVLRSGEIELLGRTDHQVKVRGFRIELGEIEATLTKYTAVKDAAVAAHADGRGGKRLVAYVVLKEGVAPPSATDLRTFLGGKLPEYMVPAVYVPLAALPLTPNGKVDRKALPAADVGHFELSAEYVAPQTPTEERLAPLWAEVLRVERVGSSDSFFDLGGHSLLATQVISRVRAEFGVELPLRKLFEASTLASFAAAIDAAARSLPPEKKIEIDWRAEATLDPAITAVGVASARAGEPQSILLTGATGFLGAFLLDELLRQTKATIVCLARADSDADALARVRDNLARFQIHPADAADRIVPLAGDLARSRFGLGESRFAHFATTIDAVYHNGAHVNFLHPYETLKAANVLGTQQVLRLATTTRLKPVHFVSTLSVLPHLNSGQPALETDRNDRPNLLENGYAQSKWVAEQLVWGASARGVPVSILRPGRIVWHSRTGALSPDDLFTRALRACIALRSVPAMDTVLEMTPVDFVGRAVVQIGRTPSACGRAYHLFNRRFVRLSQLVEWVRAAGYPLDVLPIPEWLSRVQENATTDARDALAGLLPLLAHGMPALPGDAAGSGPNLDNRHTQAALAGTGVEPPAINADSVARFLARLTADGLLAPPTATPTRWPATTNGHAPHHPARVGAK